MQDFYKQLLFLILGITMGAALLGTSMIPVNIVIICGIIACSLIALKGILSQASRGNTVHDSIEKLLAVLVMSTMLIGGSVMLWLKYAVFSYRLVTEDGYSAMLMLAVAGGLFVILVVVCSILYGGLQRHINSKD